ncbi:MAG: rhodanese-like domain-containing protein [Haloferacaceae archaeon]
MIEELTAETLRDLLDAEEPVAVVDTRDAESFESWHVEGAIRYRHTPDSAFDPATFREATGLDESDRIVTMCGRGVSSRDLAADLAAAGFERVGVVEGGMEAWSTVYDRVHVPTDAVDLEIVQVQRRAKGCLGYLIGSGDEAAVVDATRHTEEFVAAAAAGDYEITHVLDTHVHADHLSGGRALADEVGATYYLGAGAADRGVQFAYEPLERNETVRVGSVDLKALSTPGHTSEIVSYLVGSTAVLTGDTLFVDSVGRTELQFGEGEAAEGARLLYESLHRTLLAEPDAVAVLPGHFSLESAAVDPGTPIHARLGDLRREAPLLQLDREAFVDRLTERTPAKPPNYERVIDINRGVDRPGTQQEATELELGPNRCAATDD